MNLLPSKVKLKLFYDEKNGCCDVCVGALSVNFTMLNFMWFVFSISLLGHLVVIIVSRFTVGSLTGLSLRAVRRGFPPATFVVKLNQKSTPLKHTKTIHESKCRFHLEQV